MSESLPVSSFRELLQRRSPALLDHLHRMEAIANRVWIPHMRTDAGSHSGWSHLKNVERNAEKIVPDLEKSRLSNGEIFLLLAAILLHDVGRVTSLDTARPCPLDCAKNPECCVYRRPDKLHPCWSYRLIKDYWYRFGLPDDHIADYCALLALWHGLDHPPADGSTCMRDRLSTKFSAESLEPYGSLRLPLLAAILRVADETENNWTRAIDPMWLNLASEPEGLYKAFRRGIEDIEFCVPGRSIIYYVPDLDVVFGAAGGECATPGLLSDTGRVLKAWGGLLSDIGVYFDRALISSHGRFYGEQGGKREIALSAAFPDAGVIDIWRRLKELYFGTLQYTTYSWPALSTALVPPPRVDLKWLLPLFAANRPGIHIHVTADGCFIRLPDRKTLERAEKSIWEVQKNA